MLLLQRIADWISDRYYNTKAKLERWRDQRAQISLEYVLVCVVLVILVIILLNRL